MNTSNGARKTATIRRRQPGRIAGGLGLALLVSIVLVGGKPPSAVAEPVLVRTEPAGNAVVVKSPQQVMLVFSGPVDAAGSAVSVLGSDHTARAGGADVQPVPTNPNELRLPVPELPKGIYSVLWRVHSGDSTVEGAFAFMVDPSGNSPSVVQQPQPVQVLSPIQRVVTKWLAFVAIMTLIGTLSLRLLVAAPVINRLQVSREERLGLLTASDRVLVLVAGAALLVFIPGTLGQLVYEAGAAAKLTSRSLSIAQ